MPQPCSVCRHPRRQELDRRLLAGAETKRALARTFELSEDAVGRHSAEHVGPEVAKALADAEHARGADLLGEVWRRQERADRLVSIAEGLLARAAGQGDIRTATSAVQAAINANREARGCLELLAKLRGELDDRPQINFLQAPDWQLVRSALLEELLAYPDARRAVAARLVALEAA
jgi:hypothetical protein